MGNFGAAVASLLDSYTKCLSLLRGFRSQDEQTSSESRSTLSKSLQSDRARVRRVYSSCLSQNGARLEKGDAPARSALRRIVKKLTTALADAVHSLGGHERRPVNYESLLALSNGSSLDAVRTINDLSGRVGSTTGSSSRGSVVSRGRQKYRHHGKPTETRSQRRSEGQPKRDKTRSKKPASRRGTRSADRHRQPSSIPEASGARNRISIVTMSSDSTKLGEVRRRLSKQRPLDRDEKIVSYPLYSCHAEETQSRKKWWKPF
ncbi:hypothetical protein FZEAL_10374 [Fusarium zealandicum]|uniref:Uncharacterized protein n=1 Tax=Fusarium zealandicum TaxID=1053134 RepID=A0A8H4XBW7_9HYPO|nr:hypothetical protein FZEAL_10374 [Fusarium zealandicum]